MDLYKLNWLVHQLMNVPGSIVAEYLVGNQPTNKKNATCVSLRGIINVSSLLGRREFLIFEGFVWGAYFHSRWYLEFL